MSVTVNNNISSLDAQRRLSESTTALSASFQRLSSGLRINKASDDAAGLSVAAALNTDSRVYSQGIRNVNDAISAVSIAEGGVSALGTIVFRLKELAEQSANGTLGLRQRKTLDSEAQALVAEYNRIATTTTFNGVKLLDGTFGNTTMQEGYSQLAVAFGAGLKRNIGSGTYASSFSGVIGNGQARFADINNDGNPDVVSVDSAQNKVDISYGNGDGTFRAFVSQNVGGPFQDFMLSDMNGDGLLDLVTSNYSGGNEKVFLATGTGVYNSAGVVSGTTIVGTESGFADLNGDGRIDIVRSSATDSLVLYGNADGSFSVGATFYHTGALSGAQNAKIADVNGDGRADIVLTGQTGTGGVVYLNNGNGTFSIAQTFIAQGFTVADDFNGDGIVDLVAASASGGYTLFGNGNGTFKFANSITMIPGNPGDVFYGDFNNDGTNDLLLTTQSHDATMLVLGNGNGTFSAAMTVETGGTALLNLTVGDINNDGVLDIGTSSVGTTRVVLGNSTASTSIEPVNLTTALGGLKALDTLTRALSRITVEEGNLGAAQSRLQFGASNLTQARQQFTASASRIMDVDVAEEAAQLTRNNILQQAGAAVLAQANQQPALALQLLKTS